MTIVSKAGRVFMTRGIAFFLIIGVLFLWPAGDLGVSLRYARAQVTFGEPSPTGNEGTDAGGQAQGAQQAGSDVSSGQATQGGTAVGGVVSGVISSGVANSGLNAAAHAMGLSNIAPTSSTAVGISVAGSALGLGLSLAGVSFGISLVVAAVVAVISAVVGLLDTPTVSPVPSMVDPDIAPTGNGGCFKAGTLVASAVSADGRITYRNIETFRPGDEVLGVVFDAEGNPVLKPGRVLRPLRHEAKQYPFSRLIAADGTAIVGTSNHVIITSTRNEGVRMENISRGQPLVTVVDTPQWDSVADVTSLKDEITPVLNIETTTDNYLVSQNGKGWVLVHNGGK